MGVSGQHHTLAMLYPGERTPGTHWIGGWMGPRAGLDAGARRKILCLCRGSNPDRPARNQTLYCLSYHGSSCHTNIHLNHTVCKSVSKSIYCSLVCIICKQLLTLNDLSTAKHSARLIFSVTSFSLLLISFSIGCHNYHLSYKANFCCHKWRNLRIKPRKVGRK
jgi:hypothetical protein